MADPQLYDRVRNTAQRCWLYARFITPIRVQEPVDPGTAATAVDQDSGSFTVEYPTDAPIPGRICNAEGRHIARDLRTYTRTDEDGPVLDDWTVTLGSTRSDDAYLDIRGANDAGDRYRAEGLLHDPDAIDTLLD